MRVIVTPSRGGKTTKLIKMADGRNAYIVCSSHLDCERVFHIAKHMGAEILHPITFDEFLVTIAHLG